MKKFRQFHLIVALPVIILLIGTVGFMAIEKLSFLDAFYLTIVTISTVGYGDIHPSGTGGKIFGIFLIIIGIGTFLTILTNVTQWLIQSRQNRIRRHRLNMLIGVFFTEVGNNLLRIFTGFDPQISNVRKDFLVNDNWSEREFHQLRGRLRYYEYEIDPTLLDLKSLASYLKERCDLLVRQIENPDLVEHEAFTELLWAVVHLRDELVSRESLDDLPETDIAHLVVDVNRAYSLLTRQWTEYLQYLKNRYPFLFSLALRTNPFVENPSAVVR